MFRLHIDIYGYHDVMLIKIYTHNKMALVLDWSVFWFYPSLQLLN